MHADHPVDGMRSGVGRPHGLPARAGIGLRAPHYREILETRPDIGWVEVHSENYFGDGGQPLHYLERIRALYPLSLHGVGLALGSSAPLDLAHVAKLARLIDRFEPGLVSDHLCWAAAGGRHANDLLPMPYTEEALDHVCARISEVQERLGRRADRAAHRLRHPARRQQRVRQCSQPWVRSPRLPRRRADGPGR